VNREGLDARLRRHFARVDTAPGFEARVLARVAALPSPRILERRLEVERQQFALRKRLRREAWFNAATALGVGAAALAAVWRHGPEVSDRMRELVEHATQGGGLGVAAVALGAWFVWWSWRAGAGR